MNAPTRAPRPAPEHTTTSVYCVWCKGYVRAPAKAVADAFGVVLVVDERWPAKHRAQAHGGAPMPEETQ